MDTVTGVLFILFKGGSKLKVIAWIGLVISVLNVLLSIVNALTGKKIAHRIINFIGAMLYVPLVYFYYVYIF